LNNCGLGAAHEPDVTLCVPLSHTNKTVSPTRAVISRGENPAVDMVTRTTGSSWGGATGGTTSCDALGGFINMRFGDKQL
jgi:hypothetical protein